MGSFFERPPKGLTSSDMASLLLLKNDYFTPETLRELIVDRGALNAAMAVAAEARDVQSLEYLDHLYDAIQELINKNTEDWPEDKLPPILDDNNIP